MIEYMTPDAYEKIAELERELNEAKRDAKEAWETMTHRMEQRDAAEAERDTWRKVADELVGLLKMWHDIKNVQPDDDMEAIAAYEKLKAETK